MGRWESAQHLRLCARKWEAAATWTHAAPFAQVDGDGRAAARGLGLAESSLPAPHRRVRAVRSQVGPADGVGGHAEEKRWDFFCPFAPCRVAAVASLDS